MIEWKKGVYVTSIYIGYINNISVFETDIKGTYLKHYTHISDFTNVITTYLTKDITDCRSLAEKISRKEKIKSILQIINN